MNPSLDSRPPNFWKSYWVKLLSFFPAVAFFYLLLLFEDKGLDTTWSKKQNGFLQIKLKNMKRNCMKECSEAKQEPKSIFASKQKPKRCSEQLNLKFMMRHKTQVSWTCLYLKNTSWWTIKFGYYELVISNTTTKDNFSP